jgi:hypothetical protein
MNVGIGNEAAQFPEKEYINGIFLAVQYVNKKFQRQHFPYIAAILFQGLFIASSLKYDFGNLDWYFSGCVSVTT